MNYENKYFSGMDEKELFLLQEAYAEIVENSDEKYCSIEMDCYMNIEELSDSIWLITKDGFQYERTFTKGFWTDNFKVEDRII